jgi:hypothetical protein
VGKISQLTNLSFPIVSEWALPPTQPLKVGCIYGLVKFTPMSLDFNAGGRPFLPHLVLGKTSDERGLVERPLIKILLPLRTLLNCFRIQVHGPCDLYGIPTMNV